MSKKPCKEPARDTQSGRISTPAILVIGAHADGRTNRVRGKIWIKQYEIGPGVSVNEKVARDRGAGKIGPRDPCASRPVRACAWAATQASIFRPHTAHFPIESRSEGSWRGKGGANQSA